LPRPLLSPLDLVKLPLLMAVTRGRPEVRIGLIDGPIAIDHPDLATENVRQISAKANAACSRANSAACRHGTFVAGVLSARRESTAPAICPQCILLVRPIFAETTERNGQLPIATPEDLATAILECVDAGARVVNLSVALGQASAQGERRVQDALDHAARRGVVVVVAAGNERAIGSSVITRHPGTVPVVAYDSRGRPIDQSNLGASIGRKGIGAPGDRVISLGTDGKPLTLGGTSAAAPFVSGAIALLWSLFPAATAAKIRSAIAQGTPNRRTVIPPLLDAWKAYQFMKAI
jgi:subtilisin family serine protease